MKTILVSASLLLLIHVACTVNFKLIADIDNHLTAILSKPNKHKGIDSNDLFQNITLYTVEINYLKVKITEDLGAFNTCTKFYERGIANFLVINMTKEKKLELCKAFGWNMDKLQKFKELMDRAEDAWLEFVDVYVEKLEKRGVKND